MYNWGQPTNIWSSLGENLARIGQSASQWVPMLMQMQQQRSQAPLQMAQAYAQIAGNPLFTDEQKRALLQQIQTGWQKDPAFRGVQFPSQPVMTPGTPAVPGTPGVPGTPPAPQDINTATGGLTPPTGYQPGTPGTPAVAPQPTGQTQIALPPADIAYQPISQVMPQVVPALEKILGPNAGMMRVVQLQQLAQLNPAIQMVLSQTGFQQAFGGGAGTGSKWGDFFPRLRDTPQGASLADQPIPINFIDMKTGQPNLPAMESYLRAQGLQPMTAYEEQRLAQTQQTRGETLAHQATTDLRSEVDRAVGNARTIAQGGGTIQQVHNALAAARNTILQFKKQHPDIDVSAIEATIPNSQDLIGAGTSRDTQLQIALRRLGMSEALFPMLAQRLGLQIDDLKNRIAQNADKISPRDREILNMWNNPAFAALPDTDPRKQKMAPVVNDVFKRLTGVDLGTVPQPPSPPRPTPVQKTEAVRYARVQALEKAVAALQDQITNPAKYGLKPQDVEPLKQQLAMRKALLDQEYIEYNKTHPGGAGTPTGPGAPKSPGAGESQYQTKSSGTLTVAQVMKAIQSMRERKMTDQQIHQELANDGIPPQDFGY